MYIILATFSIIWVYNSFMKIFDIYKKYSITRLLQFHQLRAAAVGKLIADNFLQKNLIDEKAVITTLLLHDMGNIIKFDLDNSPKLLKEESENLQYWKKIKNEFIEKYGKDEHVATAQIGKELGVSKVVEGFLSKLKSVKGAYESSDFNLKICFYSDLRCGPFGILSVDERFDDLLLRYRGRNHPIADLQRTQNNRKCTLEIEKQLQEFVSFDLKRISDQSIENYIEGLKYFYILNPKS